MASSDASPLIGTWKQLSGTMVEEGSTSERSNLSAAPNGFVNFSADGRLILLSTDSARKKPAGEVPTAAEAEALYRSMIAYAGTYKLAGNKVTTSRRPGTNPGRVRSRYASGRSRATC